MAPIVRTVLGDISPADLGVTMTHEHLLLEFGRWQREAADRGEGSAPTPRLTTDDPRAGEPLSLNNIGWSRRNWAMHPANLRLDDEDLAIAEIRRFKQAGGNAVVDATNPDLYRQPQALVRIAQSVDLHIVMGAGHYIADFHPPDMDGRDEERIATEILADVTEGCDGTTIRAGVIGEIGYLQMGRRWKLSTESPSRLNESHLKKDAVATRSITPSSEELPRFIESLRRRPG